MLTRDALGQENHTLRDGARVLLRPSTPSVEPVLSELLRALSLRSRALRFGTAGLDLAATATLALRHPGVIALGDDGRALGHAWFVPTDDRTDPADMAIVVRDDAQARGLGTLLLRTLARLAQVYGVVMLEAFVFPHNVRMQRLLETCGLPVIRRRPDFAGTTFELATSAAAAGWLRRARAA